MYFINLSFPGFVEAADPVEVSAKDYPYIVIIFVFLTPFSKDKSGQWKEKNSFRSTFYSSFILF